MYQVLLAAGAIAALSAAVPARAVSVVDGSCAIGASSGCLFLGSLTAATVAETQAKFNLYNDIHILAGSNIALAYLF